MCTRRRVRLSCSDHLGAAVPHWGGRPPDFDMRELLALSSCVGRTHSLEWLSAPEAASTIGSSSGSQVVSGEIVRRLPHLRVHRVLAGPQ